MKWKLQEKLIKPWIGDIRVKRRFLLFPKVIQGEKRWLKVNTWMEIYSFDFEESFYWKALRWLD